MVVHIPLLMMEQMMDNENQGDRRERQDLLLELQEFASHLHKNVNSTLLSPVLIV